MSQNRTPAAKDILDQQADNVLERYGSLSEGFEQAQNAQQPLEASQDHSQADNAPQTRTSAARDILDQQADNALEQYGQTSQTFNAAHDNEQAQDSSQGRESSMITDDQPKHELRPDDQIAKSVDRDSFNDRWNQERQDAQQDHKNDDQQTHGR